MVGTDDLKRIAHEIENRLQQLGEDVLDNRLTRDLDRARLYLQAVVTGHADLIPERLSRELLQRYRPPPADDAQDESDDS